MSDPEEKSKEESPCDNCDILDNPNCDLCLGC